MAVIANRHENEGLQSGKFHLDKEEYFTWILHLFSGTENFIYFAFYTAFAPDFMGDTVPFVIYS